MEKKGQKQLPFSVSRKPVQEEGLVAIIETVRDCTLSKELKGIRYEKTTEKIQNVFASQKKGMRGGSIGSYTEKLELGFKKN